MVSSISSSNLRRKCSLLAALFFLSSVSAFPNGAGGCVGGVAAVGGRHLDTSNNRAIIEGELAQGDVSVLIDNTNRLIPLTAYDLETQTDYILTVETDNAAGFRGILLRLEGAGRDLTGAILPVDDAILHDATACAAPTVVGVTHLDNEPKATVSAKIRFNAPGTVNLDITIVGANNADGSVYGHNGFIFSVTGDAYVETSAPATLPPGETATPTASPTVADITGTFSPTFSAAAPPRFRIGVLSVGAAAMASVLLLG